MYFHAKILAPDGTAFSKSKGNGVDPLTVIEAGYGADALRTYICFISPPDVESPWNEAGVPATFRFLNRCWVLVQQYLKLAPKQKTQTADLAIKRAIHRCIQRTSQDIQAVKLNTAIAVQMELVNRLYQLKVEDNFSSGAWQFALESLAMLLGPFAPHLAEELWHQLGHQDSVHVDHWPELDEAYLTSDQLTIAVQVNGKLRGQLSLPVDTDEATVVKLAKQLEAVKKQLKTEPKRVIYVAGRLVNLVG